MKYSPILSAPPTTHSTDISSIMNRIKSGKIKIDDFQRAGRQWTDEKKSLFIESVLNNLLVPGFIFAVEGTPDGEIRKVIDGQQRLETLRQFYFENFRLVGNDRASYNLNTCDAYAGKTLDELDGEWHERMELYLLTIIELRGAEPSARREIFRRINQGGVPLSPQDLRLATYSEGSESNRFIRLVGIHNPTEKSARDVIDSGNLDFPWGYTDELDLIHQPWYQWWDGKQISIGQSASEMFLWYLVSYSIEQMSSLVKDRDTLRTSLQIEFNDRVEEVLDIYCAAIQQQDKGLGHYGLPSLNEIQILFEYFRDWIEEASARRLPRPDRFRNLAIFIGAAKRRNLNTKDLSSTAWDLLKNYCNNMTLFSREYGVDLPQAHGRWFNSRETQVKNTNNVINMLLESKEDAVR